MADFSEMLNGILSNPQAMQQRWPWPRAWACRDRADSLSRRPPLPLPLLPQQHQQGQQQIPQPDPAQLLQGFLQLSKQMGGDDRQLALFQALKPFVRPERAEKLDRAIQVARISRLAGNTLQKLGPQILSGR